MCGIVAIASEKPFIPVLTEALERLEYRGYDSSGIAVCGNKTIQRHRVVGKVTHLKQEILPVIPTLNQAHIGIAHVRWATHGAATIENAHPQSDGQIAVVHNGIIENFAELKNLLPNVAFESQTDTEVIVRLISQKIQKGSVFSDAVLETIRLLKGTFALVILNKDEPHTLIAVKKSSPLMLGIGEGEWEGSVFVASDAVAISPWIKQQVDLNDNEICIITQKEEGSKCEFQNFLGEKIQKEYLPFHKLDVAIQKGDFSDFTIKEIHEQPHIIQKIIEKFENRQFASLLNDITHAENLNFIGCGSSFYAGFVGKYLAEMFCHIPTSAEVASEFRYRTPTFHPNTLHVFMSQSGETIDTLAALNYVKDQKQTTLVITNVIRSIMAKAADYVFNLDANPEFGVVSTKAFTAQLAAIICIILSYLQKKSSDLMIPLFNDFKAVPALLNEVLTTHSSYEEAAQILMHAKTVLFLGRGVCYPVAMEGALKFKEISYIHAEGYPAGEMKHGPIALIDSQVLSVVIAPSDELFDKTVSNVQEIIARNGRVILCTDAIGAQKIKQQNIASDQLYICIAPETGPISKIFIYSVIEQLIAYHTAKYMKKNIDRPRNLAKSVTVE